MMRRSLIAALTVCSLAVGLAAAADWPNFFGPTRNGLAPDTGLNKDWRNNPPPVLWKLPMHDNGFAGPSIADGKAFIIDRDGENDVVKCLKLQDGSEVWRYSYVEGGAEDYGYARSTPTYDNGKLYTLSRLGILCCLDATAGRMIWSKSLLRDFGGRHPQWKYAFSPLIDGDRLIVQTGSPRGNVIALDKNNGATLWVSDNTDPAGYATAAIATILGRRQYVIPTGSSFIGVDDQTGRTLWRFPWENKCKVNASQPIIEGNFVFITSGYNIGCALLEITPQGAQARWQNRIISAHFNSPIYYNGYIYSTSDTGGALVCMSPQQGQVAWQQRGFEKGGLLIADEVIIAVAGGTGDVIMCKADPSGYQELGRIKPLGGRSWSPPVLADGYLLVRNQQALACVKVK
ncbi:MAG: PQQ-binding-like beta-propeller repeat protein [Armatimonadetes bacterium]|nr:PQQ-binding-like beta-propeller repeat protein [Armatimonadota bacterium]